MELYKRFSIGFTLAHMSEEQYRGLVDEFADYVAEVYFSPPFGTKFHTRKAVAAALSPSRDTERRVFRALEYVCSKGIRLTLALNTTMLRSVDAVEAAVRVKQRLDVASITTLLRLAPTLKPLFPATHFTCSYNEGVKSRARVDEICESRLFDSVVFGNAVIRDLALMRYAAEQDLPPTLLLNNGCSFACEAFCSPSSGCLGVFERNLRSGRSVTELYAEQSILPWEFHEHYVDCRDIRLFKISSRPSSYRYLKNCLSSYVTNRDRAFVEESSDNYHLWARLAHFGDYYRQLDFDEICAWKRERWSRGR